MSEKIKVITFNLRVAVKVDGVNYFDNRLPRIIEFLKAEQPDVVGFQEVNAHMKELLNQNIEDYVLVGCGREKDYNGESALIGYRKDKFELIKFENFWLSATPDVPGSRYGFDQSVCPRITSAALLKARSGGSPFWFVNTHLDHEGKMARLFGAMQLMQFMSSRESPRYSRETSMQAPTRPRSRSFARTALTRWSIAPQSLAARSTRTRPICTAR